jgi:undecaprenyl-diphosphatase
MACDTSRRANRALRASGRKGHSPRDSPRGGFFAGTETLDDTITPSRDGRPASCGPPTVPPASAWSHREHGGLTPHDGPVNERSDRRASALILGVGFVVCAAFAALAGQVYDAVTEADGIAVLDHPALDAALAVRTPGLSRAVSWFTDLGGPVPMTLLVTTVAVGFALLRRSFEPLMLTGVTAAGSVAMTVIGKAAVARARPPIIDAVPPFESSFSFPSGHSLNAMALAGVLAYLAVTQWAHGWARAAALATAGAFAVAMGLSRVYLGHHWFTDVLGAWALALAWLTVVVTAHRLQVRATRARRRPLRAPGGRTHPVDPV